MRQVHLRGHPLTFDRGRCDVVTTGGVLRADTAFVPPHDPLRVVCTGDWAVVEPVGDPRYVRTYPPRRSAFVRSTSAKRSEGPILAANVDHAIVAVPLAGNSTSAASNGSWRRRGRAAGLRRGIAPI